MECGVMDEDKHTMELPKIKEEELFQTRDLGLGTIVNDNSEIYVIKSNNNFLWIFALISFVIIAFCFIFFNKKNVVLINNVSISKIEIVNYIPGKDTVDIAVIPTTKQSYCGLLNKVTGEEITFQKVSNEKCYLTVSLEEQIVYFKNSKGVSSKKLSVNDYVVYINTEDKYYMPVNSEEKLYNDLVVVGNPDIKWISSFENVISIENNLINTDLSTTSSSSMTSPINLITVLCIQPGQNPDTLSSWIVFVHPYSNSAILSLLSYNFLHSFHYSFSGHNVSS